jgi:hypothetical protein
MELSSGSIAHKSKNVPFGSENNHQAIFRPADSQLKDC